MQKHKSVKEQLATTVQSSKIAAEQHLNQIDLDERINKAEAIVKTKKEKNPTSEKMIRDAFTMQQTDVETIKEIKKRCLRADIDANKSLIVRAGIQILSELPIEKLKETIVNLPKIKVGRPKN
ncbi:MAG: hypothetical protein JO131_01345 [Gammaproteobacteria bacterium]|nr:hypothetical protein [Gammaproteobacteria bacterium]